MRSPLLPSLLLTIPLLSGCALGGKLTPTASMAIGDLAAGAPFVCAVVDQLDPAGDAWCEVIAKVVSGVLSGTQTLFGKVGARPATRYVALAVPGEKAFGLLDEQLWTPDVERQIVAGLVGERARRVKGHARW